MGYKIYVYSLHQFTRFIGDLTGASEELEMGGDRDVSDLRKANLIRAKNHGGSAHYRTERSV